MHHDGLRQVHAHVEGQRALRVQPRVPAGRRARVDLVADEEELTCARMCMRITDCALYHGLRIISWVGLISSWRRRPVRTMMPQTPLHLPWWLESSITQPLISSFDMGSSAHARPQGLPEHDCCRRRCHGCSTVITRSMDGMAGPCSRRRQAAVRSRGWSHAACCQCLCN